MRGPNRPNQLVQAARRLLWRRGRGTPHARRQLLGRWVTPHALVFDLGANIGELSAVFAEMGAGVVAVEPHPDCIAELHRRFSGRWPVHIVGAAVSAEIGHAQLHLGSMSEISTLSDTFRAAYAGQEGVHWLPPTEVVTTTLDALIAAHGVPVFAKLDLEGHEPAALEGLSRPLPALSIEYNARLRDQALACIDRLETLAGDGRYRWNLSPYEHYQFALPGWLTAAEMARWLTEQPASLQTGDLYAELRHPSISAPTNARRTGDLNA